MGASIVIHQVLGELVEGVAAHRVYRQVQSWAGNLHCPRHTVQDLQAGDVGQQIVAMGIAQNVQVDWRLAKR